ncbi:MAG: hypothetical protein GXO70_09295 [Acidobacteria bacterium]|nr:hypothetical protein [Acidobacteriota bacterium]
MAEEIRKRFFSSKAILFSFMLLLLVFPPILRYEFLKVQKVQLILFLFVGGVLVFRYYGENRQVLKILFLLFGLFPALYAGAGFFRGFSLYTISKELLFFVMPLCMYAVFVKASSFEGWMRAVILFAVAAALVQIIIFMEFQLAGGILSRNVLRHEFVYLTFPVMLAALWIVAGGRFLSGIRKWIVVAVLVLGMFTTLSRGDFLGILALLVFSAGGFYRSSGRMRVWLLLLCLVPLFYFVILNNGTHFSGEKQADWRSYEVQTFMSASGPGQAVFWIGNAIGWELPVPRTLRVYSSDTLTEINKFHDFWLYLLSKMGVVGTVLFWGALLFFLFFLNDRLFSGSSGRLSRFMLGYLAFLCFVTWNYHGGPSMAFQQSVLFGLALSLTRFDTDSIVLSEGNSP